MSRLEADQLVEGSLTASCAANPGLPCILGQPQNFADRSGMIGNVAVARCKRCGIGVTTPSLGDVAFLYEKRESQDFQPLSNGLARTIKTLVFTRDARKLLRQIGRAPRQILDFGCGSGLFTRCLGDVQTTGSIVGTDFHPLAPFELEDSAYVPNVDLARYPGNFDLIIAMHVIEHDDQPQKILRQLKSLGNKDSIFVFEVPNIDCVWAPVFGRSWDAWYLPFHRVHFTRLSLRHILNREGFAIVRELNVSIPSMGRSIANLLGLRNTLVLLLVGAVLYPIQWVVEVVSRRPSAIRIIARASEHSSNSS